MSNPNNAWDRGIAEGDRIVEAVELAAELSDEDRRLAVASINARRRQATYNGGPSYVPLSPGDATATPDLLPPLGGLLSGGSVLDGVPGGFVLEPVPRKEKKPLLRCDRCGCFAPRGYAGRLCPTCCSGTNPQPLEPTEGEGVAHGGVRSTTLSTQWCEVFGER